MCALDGTLESVLINDLREGTFYAVLRMRRGEEVIEIDSRPSDAIALALRTHSPIWIEDAILSAAGIEDESSVDKWTDFLEKLEPDAFGKYKM